MGILTITGHSTMGEVLDAYPSAQRALFRRYHIGGCSSCGYQLGDKLEEVARGHDIVDLDEVIAFLEHADEIDRRAQVSPSEVSASLGSNRPPRLLDVNGRVVVRPGAFGAAASQTNKNLLLSDHAEVDTRPRMETLVDDVKCTHGAAVGRLDEDAVFYLRSTRGVPRHAARGLLTYAFVNAMVERLRLEPLRSRVEKLVAHRLATGGGAVQT